ncbi:ATP-binding cassette domain-containing protein [Serinibacter salmoneus]|uniref:ATP-binding cassette domain-containing protein n=1 Tax=Serinibacter salmoneus TaxID=556530 RepID=UPI000BF55E36
MNGGGPRVIQVERLTKKYRQTVAVDDLSFTVGEGALFAFLGTNGAGKSTTISCMTTLLDFDAGSIHVGGREVGVNDRDIRAAIGVVFQQSLLDRRLTVRENLDSRGTFYGVGRARTDELIEMIDMRGSGR